LVGLVGFVDYGFEIQIFASTSDGHTDQSLLDDGTGLDKLANVPDLGGDWYRHLFSLWLQKQ
jgi:hypothetical protein